MDISSCLASNYKVLHYLNSKSMLSCADATRSTGYFPLKDQIRFRAGSDGDSSIQSDSSPVSSLSDPVADSSHDSSTNSFTEEFDFSLAFDRISSDDDSSSDDDDDQDNDRCSAIFNKDYLRQSSQMTLINDNDHDSTFTRSVDEDFSDDSDGLSPVVLRSNSIDILQWDKTSTVMEKPSKKAVRFADMMVRILWICTERTLTPSTASRMRLECERRGVRESDSLIRDSLAHVISHTLGNFCLPLCPYKKGLGHENIHFISFYCAFRDSIWNRFVTWLRRIHPAAAPFLWMIVIFDWNWSKFVSIEAYPCSVDTSVLPLHRNSTTSSPEISSHPEI